MPGPTPRNTTVASVAMATAELDLVEAIDGLEVVQPQDAQGDVDEHGAERRLGQVGQDAFGRHDEHARRSRRPPGPAPASARPADATTALRGGLALTAKPPMKPASTLPAPTPMKSRSTLVSKPPSSANERVVAEVCVTTMSATAKALGSSRQTR